MANARVAVGAILTTVTDTANAASSVVNSVSGGLDMLNSFVRHQQSKQRFDQQIDMADYKIRRLEDLATQEADRKKKISDLCKDPETAEYYNSAYARLSALVESFEQNNT